MRAPYCPARTCPAALLLSALLPCLSAALPVRALPVAALPCLPARSIRTPCCPQRQRALLPNTPACPTAQRDSTPCCPTRQRAPLPNTPAHQRASAARLPSAPARPAAPRASAPRCPAHLRALLPSAPARPSAQRALLPSAPARPTAQRASAPRCPARQPLVAEPAMLWLEVLVLGILVLIGRSRSRCSSFARGLSRWGSPGGGAWCATPGGPSEFNPAGSAVGRRGGSGGGQQRQQRPPETLSPKQLREWAVRWGSPGGGDWGTSAGGGEAPSGVEAASLGAFDSASTGAEPEEALHTFTLDSGASRCFFHDSTTFTPLIVPVPVTLADPSGGPVVARGATVLHCPAAPSGLLTGLHLPSFAKNLVATSVLQDQWVTVTQPGDELVAICMDSRTCEHLARSLGSLDSPLAPPSWPPLLATHAWHALPSPCVCSPQVPALAPEVACTALPSQRADPHSSSFPPTTAPLQTLHMDVWGPARVTGQGGERYFLLVVDDYMRYTTVFPLQSKADDLPILRLHSDRGGEFCSHLLEDFCGVEGIVQSYTLLASSQQNGIAERRIGLVMEVARTSMIHAAAPHFLWSFAVRYATEQLTLWPCVSHPETSPALRWRARLVMRQRFRSGVPSLLSTTCLRASSLHALFDACSLAFPPTHRLGSFTTRALAVCCPPATSPLTSPSASTVFTPTVVPRYPSRLSPWWTTPPPVAPLPPHGPAPSGVSQVDPPPLVEPLEVSSDSFDPAEGGDPTPAATVTLRRSARLVVPLVFPPRPSSPPLQPVAVDSGAGTAGAGGADTAGAGGSATGGTMVAPTGGTGARRQVTLSLERLREWAVQWGSPGGGASRARSPRAGGNGGAAAVGAVAGSPGTRSQASLSPERLREWAVRWGSPGGGTRRDGAAGSRGANPGGASAGVPGTGGIGATRGAGGSCSGGASPRGAGAGVPGTGGTGAAGGAGGAGAAGGANTGGTTRGAIGGTGVSGARRQESLSPLQLREWAVLWGSPGGGAGVTGSGGAVATRAGGTGSGGAVATGAGGSRCATTQPQSSALCHLLSLPPAATEFPVPGNTPPLLFPPTDQSQPQLLPGSLLPAPAPHTETRASTPVRGRRVVRPHAPAVPSTHRMALRPSSVPQRVVLPSPPASSLPHVPDLGSHLVRAANPTVTRLLATFVTDPSFESAVSSTLVAELVDLAALCRLDYASSLVFDSSCPLSVEGELALGCDVLEDRQFELECLVAVAPHLIAMDAGMASWKSTGTYVDEVPPPVANIVDGMWIFRVKRPLVSPPAFKARYVARGFRQVWRRRRDYERRGDSGRQLKLLAHGATGATSTLATGAIGTWATGVTGSAANSERQEQRTHGRLEQRAHRRLAQRAHGRLAQRSHGRLELRASRRPPPFILPKLSHPHFTHPLYLVAPSTGSFPERTQWSLRQQIYGLRQAPCKWHDTLRTTLAALGFAPSTADPSLFLHTDTSLPTFYILLYVDDLVFATADTQALGLVKAELQKRHTCTDMGELWGYLGLQITQDRARRTITLTQSHMVHQVLQRFGFQFSSPQPTPMSTSHSLSAPPLDESVEPSGPYPELVGCLMYLMTYTRPHLAYPLSLLARYVAPNRHRKMHWDGAKRVLHYLCSTSGMGLVLGGPGSVFLTSHSNAS
ncbi:unnamed protein product [Closterium sp. NIES-54]